MDRYSCPRPPHCCNSSARCQGPLQTISSVIRDLGDAYTRAQIGMACGSDRNLRDLGEGAVGVTLDETTTAEDVADLLAELEDALR